jgi:ribosomal protein S18 acetylase RimI-like enzyme
VYGLTYRGPGGAAAGGDFLRAAIGQCDADALPGTIDISTHAEVHADAELRGKIAEAAGFALFQEKQGYVWEDVGEPLDTEVALSFVTIEDVGDEVFADVMTRCQAGTLDRNDQYYAAGVAPGAWGKQMIVYCTEEDRGSWLLGRSSGGEIVGYVAVGEFDEPETATIAHVGVLPEARGNGHIHELLLASNRTARARGFRFILSDVDVENGPMRHAMLRAGHRDDVRNWHKWIHRIRPDEARP